MQKGIYTALITPFKEGNIDFPALEKLLDFQLKGGVSGIVVCGSTGESQTLTPFEFKLVVETCVKKLKGKLDIIVNAGTNSTSYSIENTILAKNLGADYVMLIAPYYNRPTQDGMYHHFKEIHDNTDIDLILYNVPGRTCSDIQDSTIIKLAQLPRIIGLKDASGDLSRPLNLRANIEKTFHLFSGDDITSLAFNAMGGDGCISVVSNIFPKEYSLLHKLWFEGNFEKAMELNRALLPLHKNIFCDVNPVGVKFACSLLGLCEAEVRSPLVLPSKEKQEILRTTIEKAKLFLKAYGTF